MKGRKLFRAQRIKNKEKNNRKRLIEGSHIVRGDKEQGNRQRAEAWLDVSGQVEHFQGQESCLNCSWLTWHPGRSGSVLDLETDDNN